MRNDLVHIPTKKRCMGFDPFDHYTRKDTPLHSFLIEQRGYELSLVASCFIV